MMYFSCSFHHRQKLIIFGGALWEEERPPIAAESHSQPSLPHFKELLLFFFWPHSFFYLTFSPPSSFTLSWQVGLFSKTVSPRIHTALSLPSPSRLSTIANIFRSVKPRQLTMFATIVAECHAAKQTAVGSSHLRVIAGVKWWSSEQRKREEYPRRQVYCAQI